MEIIKLRIRGNMAEVTDAPAVITSGTVGLPVEFTFDDRWDGLSKTAVFRAGCTAKAVTNLQAQAIVPWEVLEKPNCWLQIGVYGVNADGSVAIPTLWANVCVIHTGTDPEADPAVDPTLPVWQEIWNTVSELRQEALPDNVANAICPGIENPTPVDALMALFNGKAPAGFGLGTKAKWVNNFNEATVTGFYASSGGTPDGGMWVGLTIAQDANLGAQTIWKTYSGNAQKVMVRRFEGSFFSDWQDWSPSAFAPAGFGLGTVAPSSNDLNTATDCGFFSFTNDSANTPFGYGVGFSLNRYGTQYSQVAFNPYLGGCGQIAIRHADKTGWKEWEYVNPPMHYGVEYLTTERWNGKPVYVQLIDLISFTQDEDFQEIGEGYFDLVEIGAGDLIEAEITAFDGLYTTRGHYDHVNDDMEFIANVTNEGGAVYCSIMANSDILASATILLKYTKLTD